MGAMKKVALLPMAVLFVVACSDRSPAPRTALNAQLRSDLDRAASPTSDLALSQYRATQAMSGVELGLTSHQLAAAPRMTAVPRARHDIKPTVEPVTAIAVAPAPMPTMIAAAPLPEPAAGPRPTPNPVAYPADGSGYGGVHGPGGLIGVIIRGGSIGDDDHCERRPGSTPLVGRSMPVVGMPMAGGGGMGARPRGIW